MKKAKKKRDPNEIRVRACESIPKIIFIFYSNVKFYLIIGSIVSQQNMERKKVLYFAASDSNAKMNKWITLARE